MPSLALDLDVQVRALEEAGRLADEDVRQGLALCAVRISSGTVCGGTRGGPRAEPPSASGTHLLLGA